MTNADTEITPKPDRRASDRAMRAELSQIAARLKDIEAGYRTFMKIFWIVFGALAIALCDRFFGK